MGGTSTLDSGPAFRTNLSSLGAGFLAEKRASSKIMKPTHIIASKMLKLKTHPWDSPFLVLQRRFANFEAVLGTAALTRPSSGVGGAAGPSLGCGSPGHFLGNDNVPVCPGLRLLRGTWVRWRHRAPLSFRVSAELDAEGRQDTRTPSPRHRGVATWGRPPHTRPGRRQKRRACVTWPGDFFLLNHARETAGLCPAPGNDALGTAWRATSLSLPQAPGRPGWPGR